MTVDFPDGQAGRLDTMTASLHSFSLARWVAFWFSSRGGNVVDDADKDKSRQLQPSFADERKADGLDPRNAPFAFKGDNKMIKAVRRFFILFVQGELYNMIYQTDIRPI